MGQPAIMSAADPFAHLANDIHCFFDVKWGPPRVTAQTVTQNMFEIMPFHIFHYQILPLYALQLVLANVKHRHHIRVIQICRRLRLIPKTAHKLRVKRKLVTQSFNCHHTV